MQSIGFKEWAIICEALGRGDQSIILRKGGLSEGHNGFSFQHGEFFLFPTFFHGQLEKTRVDNTGISVCNAGGIEIGLFARLEATHRIVSWAVAERLEPMHLWQRSVVRERFEYDKSGELHVALVRIFRLEPKWVVPNRKSYGGCRSWVRLPERPSETKLHPVLGDEEHHRRRDQLRGILGQI